MKKRKKQEKNIVTSLIAITTVLIIVVLVLLSINKTPAEKELNKAGYTTTNTNAFYNNVVTNNTLDDYYNKVANNENASYEEYYIAKESLNYIELKMIYQDNVQTTINITTNLRGSSVSYNYERSTNSSHLLMEGDSMNNYECNIISSRGISDSKIQEECNSILDEVSNFINKRNELLENEEVQKLVNEPIKEYVE